MNYYEEWICYKCRDWKWSTEHRTKCQKPPDFGQSVNFYFPPNGDGTWSIKPTIISLKLDLNKIENKDESTLNDK